MWENHFDNRTNQVVPQFDKKIVDTCQKINNLETYVQNQIRGFIESQEKQTQNKADFETLKDSVEKQKKEVDDLLETYNASVNDNDIKQRKICDLIKDVIKIKDELHKKLDKPINIVPTQDRTVQPMVPISESGLVQHEIPQTLVQSQSQTSNIRNTKDVKLLYCMDSNRKYIDFRRLWTLKGSYHKLFGNLQELKQYIGDHDIRSLEYILINIGINDIDIKTGKEVYEDLTLIVEKLVVDFPNVKIILSELTPRADEKDSEVKKCNELMNTMASKYKNIVIAHHFNLRDENYTMYDDIKHIKRTSVPRFASNLKRALRIAHGMDEFRRDLNNTRSQNRNSTYNHSEKHGQIYHQSYGNNFDNNRINTNIDRETPHTYPAHSQNNNNNNIETLKNAFLRFFDRGLGGY